MFTVIDALYVVDPPELLAVKVKEEVPAVVGVPVTTYPGFPEPPALEEKVPLNPAGSVPLLVMLVALSD